MHIVSREEHLWVKANPGRKFVRWQSANDLANKTCEFSDTNWNYIATLLLFKMLGLRSKLMSVSDLEKDGNTGIDKSYMNGLMAIGPVGKKSGHALALVNGVLIDPWKNADAFLWQGIENATFMRMRNIMKCEPGVVLTRGEYYMKIMVLIDGPTLPDRPYGRLNYDRRLLLHLLTDERIKASIGITEGDPGAPPVDLTLDDDEPEKKRRKIGGAP
jgi:hypothetical protein